MKQLKVGDVVCLNSSPEFTMTVMQITDKGLANCIYYSEPNGEYVLSDLIPFECLTLVD